MSAVDVVTELPEDRDKFDRIRALPNYPTTARLALAEREFVAAYRRTTGLWNVLKDFVGNKAAHQRYVDARRAYGRWLVEFQREWFGGR